MKRIGPVKTHAVPANAVVARGLSARILRTRKKAGFWIFVREPWMADVTTAQVKHLLGD
ncbi:MAG TPA: hypothetical protein VFL43_02095 [Variovorax sp.]|nr:hypothetical protein [Variovorax sp.]